MKNFIVYHANGDIVRTGSCPEYAFELQAGDGEYVIEGYANQLTQSVVNGELVDKPIVPIVETTLQDLKIAKSHSILRQCHAQILGGFISNALGAGHFYPSNQVDQLNLSATVQRASLINNPIEQVPFMCRNTANEWDYRMHTKAQIEQVGADAYNHILQTRIKNTGLQLQIAQAETLQALNAIDWNAQ